MSVVHCLKRARELLAGGWAEPLTLDTSGRICDAEEEGAAKFCAHDALRLCAYDREELSIAHDALCDTLMRDGFHISLMDWLQHPERRLPHVLVLFDRAILRATRAIR